MKKTDEEYLQIIRGYYPYAVYENSMGQSILTYIRNAGYLPGQVMAANSVCSDDLVTMQYPLPDKDFLGPFNMGGLNGFPFTGLTGLGAFTHHAPDNGTLVIVYAPHIGIPLQGDPGFVLRPGQRDLSSCCGASIKALLELGIMEEGAPVQENAPAKKAASPDIDLDGQYNHILKLYGDNEERIREGGNFPNHPIIEATEVMYENIEERLMLLIELLKEQLQGDLVDKHLFLAGGVFINTDEGYPGCAELRELWHIYLDGGTYRQEKMTGQYREFLANQ